MNTIASLTPIILFGGLVLCAIVMGGVAMDAAAKNRKK